jgi:acetyl coenzyme A synthetase (ADP forming)-like protein
VSAPYPAHLETDVVLRDGSTVSVRPATPADERLVQDYFMGLSDESRRLRFWATSVDISEAARRTVDVDQANHITLIAIAGDEGVMVGGAQYVREDGAARAEVSLSVTDRLQGQGLGSTLLGVLAEAAREHGIQVFTASVLPDNHRMIGVFRDSGFLVTIRSKPGAVEVEFPTLITAETVEQFEERERRSAAAAVRAFLAPEACAVIGASRDPASIGGRLFRNLVTQPFSGVVYPVNPKASHVQGVVAYPSVLEVPGPVDVAFIAVPADRVLDAARECGRKGVRGLVVISAGFGEAGPDGVRLQDELVQVCRSHGMRLIGPNCMGVANTDPAYALNGTFTTAWPPEGRVAFMSQSGALGLAVMNQAEAMGMGLSTFVSVGNKADVSANDLLCYWDDDERTDVVLLYLESFGNPRRFGKLSRRITRRKPIIAVKSGRSAAGARATSSHTGALVAANDSTADAVFRQHGVIRTDTLEEMFDVATLLANQPVPTGTNVAIVTNAGGLGIQCADMCEARGLHVPELQPATVDTLRGFLRSDASFANPVDMIASASDEDYRRAIATVAADPEIHALIVIYIPPLEQDAPPIAAAMVDAIRALDRSIPVLTCFMSSHGIPEALRSSDVRIPSFAYPEQAAIALAHAVDYGVRRARPEGSYDPPIGIREDEASALLARALERGNEVWLTPDEVGELLDCYGITRPREETAGDAAAAGAAAAAIGTHVALKALGPVHKTDVDAVRLDLAPGEVTGAAEAMRERLAEQGAESHGFLVQEMVPDGVEMLVGSVADPVFGPVVAVGAGGVTVELTRDVATRVVPLSDVDAQEMVRQLATFPLLDGFRGAASKDVSALEDVVLRLARLVDRHPEVLEMDCNPVMVRTHGAAVVDARVRVRVPAPTPPVLLQGG